MYIVSEFDDELVGALNPSIMPCQEEVSNTTIPFIFVQPKSEGSLQSDSNNDNFEGKKLKSKTVCSRPIACIKLCPVMNE